MNEVTFKSAESVALYASRLIIAVADDDFFDWHGIVYNDNDNLVISDYQVEGDVLIKLLDGLSIDYFNHKLRGQNFDIVQRRFKYLNKELGDRIVKLSIAEN